MGLAIVYIIMAALSLYFIAVIYFNYFIDHNIPFAMENTAIVSFFWGYWLCLVKNAA